MSCNLVNIQSLILSDTFYTWYDRTNQIISAINPVQIYDISLGTTSGLTGFTPSCTSGIFNIRVVPGPGIGVGSINYNRGTVQVDMSSLPTVDPSGYDNAIVSSRPSASFLANDDWIVVSDNSDTTLNTGAGTPKKISADRILPPTVYLPNGFSFNGDITVNGNFIIAGTASNLDSNDLRIEDRLIELSYARLVGVSVTGTTYGQLETFYQGKDFFYYNPGEGNTAGFTTRGKISSITYGGLTSSLNLHNFTLGGVSDIDILGRISLTGTNFDFSIVSQPTIAEAFLPDTQLDQSGIRIRGSQSDKFFVWDSAYNAFISLGPSGFPVNLGVSGSTAGVVSSKFFSYGYPSLSTVNEFNNKFHFVGQTGEATIRIGGLGQTSFSTNLNEQHGYWSITKRNSLDLGGTGQYQPLEFGFKPHGRTGPARTQFIIWPSASGSSYTTVSVTGSASSNNTVFNFAQGLNVDMVDGAHAVTASTPWQIPVALASGKISSDWIETQSIVKCYTITNHGLRVGDVIRTIGSGSIGFTGAKADTPANAEAIGMVSVVTDPNNFCVVTEGFISGLAGSTGSIASLLPLVTGSTYYLSATGSAGGLVLDPDSPGPNQIPINGVRKPIFQALGGDNGYVRAYQGEILFEPTDMIDIDGFQPVGVISPFVGPTAQIPTGWLLCDGNRLKVTDWTDLYNIIGQEFYAQGVTSNALTGGLRDIQVSMDGGTRNLSVNDAVRVQSVSSGLTNASVDTYVSAVQNNIVTFKNFVGGTGATGFIVTGRTDATFTSTFFLPDIRRRVLVGSTRGLTSTSLNSLYPNIKIGDFGGSNLKTLIENNIPAHSHRLRKLSGLGTTSGPIGSLQITGGITAAGGYLTDAQTDSGADNIFTAEGPVGAQGQPFDSMPDYLSVNWIIRGLRGMRARILTGHQHDDRYIRYDMAQSLGVTNRNLFRTNSKTLGDGSDGGVTFNSSKFTFASGSSVDIFGPITSTAGITASRAFVSTLTASNFFFDNMAGPYAVIGGITSTSVVSQGITTGTFRSTDVAVFDKHITGFSMFLVHGLTAGQIQASSMSLTHGLTATNGSFTNVRTNTLTGSSIFSSTAEFNDVFGFTGSFGKKLTTKKYALEVGGSDSFRLHGDLASDAATSIRIGTAPFNNNGRYLHFLNGDSNGAYPIKVGGLLVAETYSYGNPSFGNAVVQRHLAIGNTIGTSTYTNAEGVTNNGLEINGFTKVTPANIVNNQSVYPRVYKDCFMYTYDQLSLTGSMVIALPFGPSEKITMCSMRIDGFDYTDAIGPWSAHVSFYSYQDGLGNISVIRNTVTTEGRCPFNDVFTTITATGSEWGPKQKVALILGGTHCTWSYPKIRVSEFTTSYNYTDGWSTGWTGGIRGNFNSFDNAKTSRCLRRGINEGISGNFALGLADTRTYPPAATLDSLDNAPTTLLIGVPDHGLTDPGAGYVSNVYGGIHLFNRGQIDNTMTGITTRGRFPNQPNYTNTVAGMLFSTSNNFGSKIHFFTTSTSVQGMLQRAVIDNFGRFGIGLTSPNTQLDVNGTGLVRGQLSVNTNGATSDDGIGLGISGPISMNPRKVNYTVNAALGSGDPLATRVYKNVCMWEPDDGQLYGTGYTAGTLVIKSPKGWSQTQLQLTVKGHGLNANESWECNLYGFARTGSAPSTIAQWVSPSVEVRGRSPFNGNVRFDYLPNEDRTVILLGVTGTQWYYSNVYLDTVIASYNNQNNYGSGWDMYLSQATQPTGISGNTYTKSPLFHGIIEQNNGNIGIGITAPSQRLSVDGAIVSSGDMTALSDARLKTNITPIENSIEKINSINGVLYTDKDGKRRTGLIAQDVAKVLPEAVYGDETSHYSLAYGNLVGLLVEGIKKLDTKVNSLTVELKSVKDELNKLRSNGDDK